MQTKLPSSFPSLLITQFSLDGMRAFAQEVRSMFGRVAVLANNPPFGATADRPTEQLTPGQQFFDSTLGFAVWWDGAQWVDATGAPV